MTRAVLGALCALALAGCMSYASVARRNAPGVVDLSVPPRIEDGTADRYELPTGPGSRSIVAWLHGWFGGGLLRHGAGYEAGAALSIEAEDGGESIARQAWGATLGMAIVQAPSESGADAELPGALSVEAYFRHLMFQVGAGPLVYPDTRDVGVQISARGPLAGVRLRYAQDSGFEALVALEISWPLVFAWSR